MIKGGSKVTKGLSITMMIPADTTYIVYTIEKIMDFLNTHAVLTEEVSFEIKVILNELIINAVLHGNKEDKTKQVSIKVGICTNQVYAIIEDEGEGLPSEKESENTKEFEKILCLSERGRGLTIIESLCDCIKRNEKGNKVVVLKKLN
ncbi:MAG: serine/threonine-protein kinase RsbW [Clostridiales bacterium]|jgi:serine/threonine-protein kinase RsbW|nr:serine/threonine-protein kinase RsbW [Clostridiales bacterium]MDK2933722.1 serine/threonine-protein kinase RsbW [Clostridiales bacterium]